MDIAEFEKDLKKGVFLKAITFLEIGTVVNPLTEATIFYKDWDYNKKKISFRGDDAEELEIDIEEALNSYLAAKRNVYIMKGPIQ